MEELIATYGYIGIVLGGIFECEVAAVAGGIAAQAALLSLPWVIVAVTATGIAGDGLYFTLGRTIGAGYLKRKPNLAKKVKRAQDLLVRHQIPVILVIRFLWGIRAPMSFAIGMSPIPLFRFVVLGLISAVVWAVVMTLGGYFFGQALTLMLGRFQDLKWPIIGGIIGVITLAMVVRWLIVRNRPAQEDAETANAASQQPGE